MRRLVPLWTILAIAAAAPAHAQTAPPTPTPGPAAPPTPNAETPPGGVARGVIPPPRAVDPEMVQKPAPEVAPSMPVIKPPGTSR